MLIALIGLLVYDAIILYRNKGGLEARRVCKSRFSNGDDNLIEIYIENRYSFSMNLSVIDEIPHQFQRRDINFKLSIKPNETKIIQYKLRPVKRGEYQFGYINAFVSTNLSLVAKRYQCDRETNIKVYPSFLLMEKYELMAISNQLTQLGIKKIRKIGHNIEFEHIKEYVQGDDYRTINWKATARRSDLMVNIFQDEKSQNVYSLIDMGRVMQMPFEQMTLLDYAINSSLVISNVAIKKEDKAGLMTFEKDFNTFLPASKTGTR